MLDPLQELANLENAYNPSSPFYKFTFTFQNLVSVSNTLESMSTYPVTLRGYDDLKKRCEQQKIITMKIEQSLNSLGTRLEKTVSKGKLFEQRMTNILMKIRKSDIILKDLRE